MSKALIGVFSFIAVTIVIAILLVMWAIGISNQEKSLRIAFDARIKENQTNYDNMWKTIKQKYQIKGDYAKELKEIVAATVEGRKGGSLMKMITESVPNLDASIYKELMATIEGKRDYFKKAQDAQIDLKQQHDKILTLFPSSLVVGGRPPLVLALVTSTRTNEAFDSGVDDNVDLHEQ